MNMKIEDLNPNSAVSHPGNGRTDRSETADAHGETVARQHAATDKVRLSKYIAAVAVSDGPQDIRVNRVAEIKNQIGNGSYQVSSQAVAEKMLSMTATGASQQKLH